MNIVSNISALGSIKQPQIRDLKEATQEFESLFIHQLLQSMQKTIPKSSFSSRSEEIFRDLLHQEYALQIARSGGIGLAEMLYKQLSESLASREGVET